MDWTPLNNKKLPLVSSKFTGVKLKKLESVSCVVLY